MEQNMDEMLRYMRALVVLQAETLRHIADAEKPELLLKRAGFKNKEIAQILGKGHEAIAKAISRAAAAQ